MKLGLPSANSLICAFRSKLPTFSKSFDADELPRADPRSLVDANDLLTGLPGLTAFEGMLTQAARVADA